ncbi:MAG: peptide chain release factor N(5)-glutamine methyltransferase [Patescibacteria group bacterium]|nr:peptide chain release factor N(5)-glutamine methyltransferase [Patescibacteria group bacterium]
MDTSQKTLPTKTLQEILAQSPLSPLDSELIIGQILKKTKEWIYANPTFLVAKNTQNKINRLIKRRMQGEPMAYLAESKEFYGLNFRVDRNTLIPRPETELLVDLTLQTIGKFQQNKDGNKNIQENKENNNEKQTSLLVVDVGTGSGCIITALAKKLEASQKITYFASDKSAEALKIASQNFKKHNPHQKLKVFQADLLSFLSKNKLNKFSSLIITANLPYLSKKQYLATAPDIKYEPKSALIAKDMGMELIKKLLDQIASLENKTTCYTFLEIDPRQKKPLELYLQKKNAFSDVQFFKDLSKKYRVLRIKKEIK